MTDIPPRLSAALADRYTIERELGQGGMATVYLAHDIKRDRKVAVRPGGYIQTCDTPTSATRPSRYTNDTGSSSRP